MFALCGGSYVERQVNVLSAWLVIALHISLLPGQQQQRIPGALRLWSVAVTATDQAV